MSVLRKISTGIIKIKDTRTVNDGTLTKVETWTGPYSELETKQNTIGNTANSTSLAPDGPNGTLTVTYETPPSETYEYSGSQKSTEVIWQELRKPIEQHPMFKDVSETDIKLAREAADTGGAEGEALAGALVSVTQDLYKYYVRGVTEYSLGVPVVRRTKTRRNGSQGGGNAWIRDEPPVKVPGTWQWLKTADERRKDGRTFTHIEEWTAANEWDEKLYPKS